MSRLTAPLLALLLACAPVWADQKGSAPPPAVKRTPAAGASGSGVQPSVQAAGAVRLPAADIRAQGQALPAPLPASAVVAGETVRAPAVAPAEGADLARAPPGSAPIVVRAHEEAGKLGISREEAAAGPALRGLDIQGFAFASRARTMPHTTLERINAEIDAYASKRIGNSWHLYEQAAGGWVNRPWQPKNGGLLAGVISSVETMLREAAPAEPVILRDAYVRFEDGRADLDNIHVDGGAYFTVTVTLRGPGTLIYAFHGDGRVIETEAPLGQAAVISTLGRQYFTRMMGTLHSAPTPEKYRPGEERRMLILRFKRPGAEPMPSDFAPLESRNAAAVARAQRWRDAQPGRAPPKKKAGFLASLLGLE